MNNRIKLGIIGMGRMGITHYSIINSHPDVLIVGVAEPSKLVRNMLKKYTGVAVYKDYNDLMNEADINALLICTPPHIHHSIIKLAFEKNIHVFCEKPFTTNLNQGRELFELAKQQDLVGQVGYVNRYNDVFVKAKELIDNGIIGNVIRFKSEMFSCTVIQPDKGEGWRSNRETGGGALYEMAAHAIDLVNFLIGKPDKITGATLSRIYSKNVEDIVSSTFLYKDGKSGTLYVNWSDTSYRKPSNKIEIFGDKGKLLADQHSLKVYMNKENKHNDLRLGWNTIYITDIAKSVPFYVRGNEFTRQLYDFANLILNKELENQCSFADGVDTLDVIDQILKDSENNKI